MSALQLNDDLVDDLLDLLSKHDERCEDPGIALQYMAAIMAYVLGHQEMSNDDKGEFLSQLHGFSQHVLDDVLSRAAPPAAAEDAFGIWRPPAS